MLKIETLINNPILIFHIGYYIIVKLFSHNYYLLICLNFFLYSLTNIVIYQKVFKKNFNSLSTPKLIFLIYVLFLDPYRLHLVCHVLKETILIFFLIILVLSGSKLIKILCLLFLEIFRLNSWVYILIFFTYSKIKKFFNFKIFVVVSIFLIFSLAVIILFKIYSYDIFQNYIFDLINKLKFNYFKEMPVRSYDNVPNFREYEFPLGFILKNILWPLLFVSGLFLFFVSSNLFKLLGMIILLNNILIYLLTKKTFISLGLIIILVLISMHTTSYTSMFRYSYIVFYSSLIYFFLNFNFHKIKQNN